MEDAEEVGAHGDDVEGAAELEHLPPPKTTGLHPEVGGLAAHKSLVKLVIAPTPVKGASEAASSTRNTRSAGRGPAPLHCGLLHACRRGTFELAIAGLVHTGRGNLRLATHFVAVGEAFDLLLISQAAQLSCSELSAQLLQHGSEGSVLLGQLCPGAAVRSAHVLHRGQLLRSWMRLKRHRVLVLPNAAHRVARKRSAVAMHGLMMSRMLVMRRLLRR
mmetsp:Transcript_138165/g.441487  ORF Transcript_138165/g.441487 Transcript_138165/m.441487 type:complete len:218 (+) Transcript_138165:35-688(+)